MYVKLGIIKKTHTQNKAIISKFSVLILCFCCMDTMSRNYGGVGYFVSGINRTPSISTICNSLMLFIIKFWVLGEYLHSSRVFVIELQMIKFRCSIIRRVQQHHVVALRRMVRDRIYHKPFGLYWIWSRARLQWSWNGSSLIN